MIVEMLIAVFCVQIGVAIDNGDFENPRGCSCQKHLDRIPRPKGLHHKNIGAKLRKGRLFDEKVRVSTHSFRNTDFMFALAVDPPSSQIPYELIQVAYLKDIESDCVIAGDSQLKLR